MINPFEMPPPVASHKPRKRHGISGKGKGKWQTLSTLDKYRIRRDRKNKTAKETRRRNRL